MNVKVRDVSRETNGEHKWEVTIPAGKTILFCKKNRQRAGFLVVGILVGEGMEYDKARVVATQMFNGKGDSGECIRNISEA